MAIPMPGVFWEQRCSDAIFEAGFTTTSNCGEWRSCFYHPGHQVYLMVYVDDFKMSGPIAGVDACWDLIKKPADEEGKMNIILGPIGKVDQLLGCKHTEIE